MWASPVREPRPRLLRRSAWRRTLQSNEWSRVYSTEMSYPGGPESEFRRRLCDWQHNVKLWHRGADTRAKLRYAPADVRTACAVGWRGTRTGVLAPARHWTLRSARDAAAEGGIP